MLKVIGGVVVYGFALYGLNKFIEQVKVMQRVRQPLDLEESGHGPAQKEASAA